MRQNIFQEHLNTDLILASFFVVAIFTIVAGLFLALQWNQTPFIGGFVTPSMHFKKSANLIPNQEWPIRELGIGLEAKLISLNGHQVDTGMKLLSSLSETRPGQTVDLLIASEVDDFFNVQIPLINFSILAQLYFFYLPLFGALLCFFSGLWIFSSKRRHLKSISFSILSISFAIILSSYFDYFTTHKLIALFYLGIGFAAAALIQAAIEFSDIDWVAGKAPWLRFGAYLYNIILAGIAAFQLLYPASNPDHNTILRVLLGSLVFSILVFALTFIYVVVNVHSAIIRQQSQTILVATIFAFLPITIHFLITLINATETLFNPLFLLPTCILPITYAINKQETSSNKNKYRVHHHVVLLTITLLFGFGYLALIMVLNTVLITPVTPDNPLLIGGMIFLVTIIFGPLRKQFERLGFLQKTTSSNDDKELALHYVTSMTKTNDQFEAKELLHDAISEILKPKHVLLFLYEHENLGFVSQDQEEDQTPPLFVPRDAPIPKTLEKMRKTLYFNDNTNNSREPDPEKKLVDDMGSQLFTPIPGSYGILGWVALGPKDQNEPYSAEDIDLLETLTHQFSVVYERADAMASLRCRLREMEILNLIAIAINNNKDFDPLLVAVFNQIKSLLPVESFSLVLKTEGLDVYHRSFLYEQGEIIISTSQPQSLGTEFLEKIAIESGNSEIIMHDGTWFVVPLIDADKIIGAFSIGHSSEKAIFDRTNQNFINAITSLMTGAIHNITFYAKTDRDLEEKVKELYLMQQIDRDLNATRDINLSLQVTLKAALTHTLARVGSIGLIDHNFEFLDDTWQILPENENPVSVEKIELRQLDWITKSSIYSSVIKRSDLTEHMGLPEKYQWHFLILSELEDNQYVLLILHLDSPGLLIAQDIQFLARLNDHAIIALNNSLLYEDLNAVIQEKNEFISFISHELKNPLTVIKGYADILRKGMAGGINEEQNDFLTTITHNVRQMNTFIKDLSDQSYIETKSLHLVFESTPVHEVVNDVLHSYEGLIKKKFIRTHKQINKPTPKVWCDRLRLIQILSNLVSNAIKYTPENGKIIIGAEQSPNAWDEHGAAEVVHFWVTDNGFGISPEDQTHLFEKFYRSKDAHIQEIPGTGLGLRIAKSLTEMMGGKMWFESTQGKGSTFHFTMPI